MLLTNTDMGGRQHSVTGVLPHPFHTPMSSRLQSAALLPHQPSTVMLSPRASGWAGAEIRQVLLANTDMIGRPHSATGVLPHPYPYPNESPAAVGCNHQPSTQPTTRNRQHCFHLDEPLQCCSQPPQPTTVMMSPSRASGWAGAEICRECTTSML